MGRGFTLLELVVIVAIVAVLVAILGPNFIRSRARGRLTSCESNEKNSGTAFEMYSTDNAGHYPTTMTSLTPNYLKVIPTCPGAGTDSYSATYQVRFKPDGYSFYCYGTAQSSVLGLDNYPQYNSVQGLISGH
ncbi:MAG TPA: prepilin-type N-terminal cleavage/methylation domain-containing protein [Candidatus Xenobia bacterium]